MKKILLVEDTHTIREEVRDILVMEHFDVYEAVDGLDGLETTMEILPDLIISDIAMPILDGYGLLLELKKHSKTETIPIIFLSAKSDLKDIRKGMNLGADDYLTKPLSPDDLIIAVNKKLESRSKTENKFNKLKTDIAQFMPHELITPLNGILGLSDYLRENIDIPKDELHIIAQSVHNCGERLYHLIENSLIYSSLVVESSSMNEKQVSKDKIILETRDLIGLIIRSIKETRVNDIILQLENVSIKFNKYFYTKIVEELFNNAIKFSKPGNKIIITSKTVENEYVFQVENSGIGISPEQVDEIGAFIQFNRKTLEQQGIGLGLEIVKLITEQNDGKFIIDSKPDEYFKVTVQIPVA